MSSYAFMALFIPSRVRQAIQGEYFMAKSDRISDLAAELCSGAVGLAFGDVTGLLQGVAAVAGVSLLGKRLNRDASGSTARAVCVRAINSLTSSGAFHTDALDRAAILLSEQPSAVKIRPSDFADRVRDANSAKSIASELAAQLSGPGDPEVHRILEMVLEVGITAYIEDPDFRTALTPELLTRNARDLGMLVDTVDRMDRNIDTMTLHLQELLAAKGLSGDNRRDLERLSALFGIDPGNLQTADLIVALERKAEDHAELISTFSALDDRMADIARSKREADHAVGQLDYGRAESLLRDIDLAETTITASTRMLRVKVALLQGNIRIAELFVRQVRDLIVSHYDQNYASATIQSIDYLSEWATRNGSSAAKFAAIRLATEFLEKTESGADPETRMLRIRALVDLTNHFCSLVEVDHPDITPDFIEAIVEFLDNSSAHDAVHGTSDWCRLNLLEANVYRILVRHHRIEDGEAHLSNVTVSVRNVQEVARQSSDGVTAMAAASMLVALNMVRYEQAPVGTNRAELLAEGIETLETHVLNESSGASTHETRQAEFHVAYLHMLMADESQGEMRDIMLAASASQFEAIGERQLVEGDFGGLVNTLFNIAYIAVGRAEGARGQKRERLRADAKARIEAAEAAVVDNASPRFEKSLKSMRTRLAEVS